MPVARKYFNRGYKHDILLYITLTDSLISPPSSRVAVPNVYQMMIDQPTHWVCIRIGIGNWESDRSVD